MIATPANVAHNIAAIASTLSKNIGAIDTMTKTKHQITKHKVCIRKFFMVDTPIKTIHII